MFGTREREQVETAEAPTRPALEDVSPAWAAHVAHAEELRKARAVLEARLTAIRAELAAVRETPPDGADLAAAILADGADATPAEAEELRARYKALAAKRDRIASEQERHRDHGRAIRTAAAPALLAAVSGEREPLLEAIADAIETVLAAAAELSTLEDWLDRRLDSRRGWPGVKSDWLPRDRLREILTEIRGA